MSAVERHATAPRLLLRWLGIYFLVLTGLSSWAAIFYFVQGGVPWYHFLLVPTFLTIGVGLIRKQRWSYVGAVVAALHNVIWIIGLAVWAANEYELAGILTWGVVAGEVLLAAIPLLLLRESGRSWFRDQSPPS